MGMALTMAQVKEAEKCTGLDCLFQGSAANVWGQILQHTAGSRGVQASMDQRLVLEQKDGRRSYDSVG